MPARSLSLKRGGRMMGVARMLMVFLRYQPVLDMKTDPIMAWENIPLFGLLENIKTFGPGLWVLSIMRIIRAVSLLRKRLPDVACAVSND